MNLILLPGYSIRTPNYEDVPEMFSLITAWLLAETPNGDFTVITESEIYYWIHTSASKSNIWIVSLFEHHIVGCGIVWNLGFGHFSTWIFTHPEHTGRSIGKILLQLAESRAYGMSASLEPDVRITLQTRTGAYSKKAQQLMENTGYSFVRPLWHMGIELTTEPVAPTWSSSISVRSCSQEHDMCIIYTAFREGGCDLWNFIPKSFEAWVEIMTGRGNYDPSLWFLALDKTEIAGFILCETGVTGWIYELVVLSSWRRQGLGTALLQHAFREFYHRGQKRIKLNVDAWSPTGAQHLYQRNGMSIGTEFSVYEKELRSGVDIVPK